MSLLSRGLFVVAGVIGGTTAINMFVLGNHADYGLPNSRLGAWREAAVRPACYPALEFPERDPQAPKMPPRHQRISSQDVSQTVQLTAALHCYVVTQRNAVCDPNNRAYIVDYIGKYFGAKDHMIDLAGHYGTDDIRNVRALWDSPNNRAIEAALHDHIRNGRLTKSDFGWSPPAALKQQLVTFAGTPDSCLKEQRWTAVKVEIKGGRWADVVNGLRPR